MLKISSRLLLTAALTVFAMGCSCPMAGNCGCRAGSCASACGCASGDCGCKMDEGKKYECGMENKNNMDKKKGEKSRCKRAQPKG